MLKKLLKHECIATARIMGPLYLVVLLLAVFSNVTARISESAQSGLAYTLSGVGIFTFVLSLIAVCLMAVVIMISRFHSNLLGSQGYLMMTLPASIHKLVLAKVITSILWFCGTIALCVLALIVMTFDSHTVQGFAEFFRAVIWLLNGCDGDAGLILARNEILVLLVEGGLVTILAMAAFTLFVYASIATGHSFSRHKVLLSFVTFFGINFLLETAGMGLLVYLVQYDTVFAPYFGVETFFQGMQMLFGLAAVLLLALCGGFYALTWFMMKRRLNLQ